MGYDGALVRRRVVIENRTGWQTRHLRVFVVRVLRDEMPDARTVTVTFTIRRRRGTYCTGFAYYHSGTMRVTVPATGIDPFDLAHVLGHEAAHLRGVRHRTMGAIYKDRSSAQRFYPWAGALPLALQPKPQRLTLDARRAQRLAHARRKVDEWTRRARLAQNRVKRWQRRYRAQEALLARAAKVDAGPEGDSR